MISLRILLLFGTAFLAACESQTGGFDTSFEARQPLEGTLLYKF